MSTHYPASDFKLSLRNDIFPYEYLDLFDNFDDYELPLREEFFSTLRGEECSQENYDEAQSEWTAFEFATVEDYFKLYLSSDVCQLANVFHNFRSISNQNYQLDPAYLVSATQLSWNSMFTMQDLKLELISDFIM